MRQEKNGQPGLQRMGLSTSGINDNDVPNWLAKEAEFTPNNNARPESRRPTENAEQLRVKDEESQELSSLSNNITYWNLILDQGVVTERIILHRFLGSGTRDDPYLVEYIPRDPRNPMGFPQWKKWAITMVMAIATLAIAFVSSAYAGGMEQIIQEFHCSMQVSILGISLFVLGFAIGPLFWAPLSEMYGRQKLFFGTFAALTAFNIGAANANSIEALLLMRFFAGAFGSSPLTNAGGVIADMFPASERGLAMAVFAAAPNMGPVMGPIAGGFLGQSAGWRWVEGLLAVFSGLTWLLMAFTVPETYSPVLLRERALRLTNVTGKVYVSKLEAESGKLHWKEVYKIALSRPWLLLLREPIVLMLSIYVAIIYGTLYMLFAAYPIVYQQSRGWSQGVGGLPFLGVAVGMLLAILYSILENSRYNRVANERFGGFAPPEQRLPPALVGCVCIPIGLFWFAWTNSPDIHWFASIAASTPFGFGMVIVFLSIINYLIDSYTIFAASVLAANAVLRCTFATAFPLFTGPMYQNLGIHWAASIPAFMALVCLPAPFLFYKYGERIRLKCKYAARAAEFMRMLQESKESSDSSPEDGFIPEEKVDISDSNQYNGGNLLEIPSTPYLAHVGTRRSRSPGSAPYPDLENGLQRELTRGSTLTRKSQQVRTSEMGSWENNPFDIERVYSSEAFKSQLQGC